MNFETLDIEAKKIFDSLPHNHPQGHIPQWDIQPETIKNVFRAYYMVGYRIEPRPGREVPLALSGQCPNSP